MPLDDAELVRLARDGDTAAYDVLVRRHQDVAQRAAWLVSGSPEEAADAVQDGFVKAWQALDRFRDGAAFRPWLLRIVVNTARNRRRSAWRFEAMRVRAGAAPVAPVESAEASAVSHAEQETLLGALRRLPERDRAVVGCRYLLELSEQETAAVLGVPAGTVKSRLSRALVRLRSDLERSDPVRAGDAL